MIAREQQRKAEKFWVKCSVQPTNQQIDHIAEILIAKCTDQELSAARVALKLNRYATPMQIAVALREEPHEFACSF